MGLSYQDLLVLLLGPDSGWRVRGDMNSHWKADLLDVLEATSEELPLVNRHGIDITYTLYSLGAGVPCPIERNGMDFVQGLLPTLMNKVMTGPLGRSRVTESDFRGLFGSLSLGLSTEEHENVRIIWFGDWASSISALTTFVPQVAVASQIGLATAVAVLPSADAGVKTHKGHCS